MLKLQASARGRYNTAEMQGYIVFFLCVFSAITIIIPNTVNMNLRLFAPIIFDIFAWIVTILRRNAIAKAANYRAMFDEYVLNIDNNTSSTEKKKLTADAEEYIYKHKRMHNQLKNGVDDKPPGVKDWYDVPTCKSEIETQFDCQKQNIWWDEELYKRRIAVHIVLVLFSIILLFIFLLTLGKTELLRCLLSSAFLINEITCIKNERQYRRVAHKIEGAVELMEETISNEHIKVLQGLINEKRRCDVVGINLMHTIVAKDLSNRYQARRDANK